MRLMFTILDSVTPDPRAKNAQIASESKHGAERTKIMTQTAYSCWGTEALAGHRCVPGKHEPGPVLKEGENSVGCEFTVCLGSGETV